MMEAFVCLCGTRVSQVSLDQVASPVDPVVLSRGQERASMRQQGAYDDGPTLREACRRAQSGRQKRRAVGRADRRRHTVVQAPQAGVNDLALGLVVAVGQMRVCAVQIRVGRGIVELCA